MLSYSTPAHNILWGAYGVNTMVIFALEAFATLKSSQIGTITVQTVAISNTFLLIGIVTGFVIALSFMVLQMWIYRIY